MNRIILLILLFCFPFNSIFSQSKKKEKVKIESEHLNTSEDSLIKKEKNYNLWSVNLNAGTNIATHPFTPGYYATTHNYITDPNFNHFDLNVRKMFNTKYGLMLDFGYDNFSNETGSPEFSNNLYRVSLQSVINMHRIMNFEEFTNTFGLQFHVGPGFLFLDGENNTNFHYDNIMSAIVGTTLLIKISDKLVFNLDFTSITNFTHHLAFDGKSSVGPEESRTGKLYTTSLGLTYYFGKKDKHADWYYENKKDEIADLEARVADIEAMMNDMDKDGVPNYLDLENNTIAGVVVDTKGRAVDLNNNGIPDELEKYFDSKYNVNQSALAIGDNNVYSNAQMKSMINGGYVNVFFDFDKDKITPGTISAINFLIKYLNANPKSNADIIGYADEMGDINYNMDLAGRRAKKVKEMIVRSGISESRLNLSVKGEDNSVPKESKLARQLVRRVAFEVD